MIQGAHHMTNKSSLVTKSWGDFFSTKKNRKLDRSVSETRSIVKSVQMLGFASAVHIYIYIGRLAQSSFARAVARSSCFFRFLAPANPPMASASSNGAADTVCSICAKPTEYPGVRRCKACNSVQSRLKRHLDGQDEEFKDAWSKAFAEGFIDKASFFETAKNTFGDDLNKLLQEQMDQRERFERQTVFAGTGDFLDETDLEDKYKNKPERLAAVKEHARTYTCPVTKTLFYEDIKYSSSTTETSTRIRELQQLMSTEKTVKRAKTKAKAKAKAVASDSAAIEGGEVEQPKILLTEPQSKTVEKWVGDLEKLTDELDKLVKEIEAPENKEWAELLPVWVVSQCKAKVAHSTAMQAGYNIMNESKNCPQPFAELKRTQAKELAQFKEAKRRTALQIAEAKKMAAE